MVCTRGPRSIYFDTPGFEMFHTKIDGIAHRMKVRLRGYNIGNDSSPVFMEIKRKYEGPILKNRADAPYGVVRELFRPGAVFENYVPRIKNPDNARRFFYQVLSRNLRPVVNVIYEREPFLGGKNTNLENDFRVTLDNQLRSNSYPSIDDLYEEAGQPIFFRLFYPRSQVQPFLPDWVKPIFNKDFRLRKEPASKYVGTINSNPFINPSRRGEALSKSRILVPDYDWQDV